MGVGTNPLTNKKFKKFVKKTANGIKKIFYKCYQNPLWQVLKQFSKLSALGACYVTIIGGVVYKKFMIFKVFGVYLSEFLILDPRPLVGKGPIRSLP